MNCREVAQLPGDSARSVQYGVHRFETEGFAGLTEGERPGRPSRLPEEQLTEMSAALREPPVEVVLAVNLWGGKALAWLIKQRWGIDLGVRQ